MNDLRIKLSKRIENRWSPAEDDILFAEVLKAGHTICWRKVAAALPGRTNKSCRKRWIHSLDPNLRKGRWSASEDAALIDAVNMHGKHWYQVARTLNNGRTDDQCAKRWREALDPTIRKDGWTEQEDDLLVDAFRRVGRKWNEIAAALNGRPPVQCRNRWLSLARAGRFDDMPLKDEPLSQGATESPFELGISDYDSVSMSSSRRPSMSSISTCSSMSFMPPTPVFTSSPISPASSYLPHVHLGDWHTESPARYESDVIQNPLTIYAPAYGHGLRSCAPWEEEEESHYRHLTNFNHHFSHHNYNHHPHHLEQELEMASPSALSVLCDTSIALADMNHHHQQQLSPLLPLPPILYQSSSSSTFSGMSSPTIMTASVVEVVGAPYSAQHNRPADDDSAPQLYVSDDSTDGRGQSQPFTMTCPVPSCSYYAESLWDIWRHITWGHLSTRRNADEREHDREEEAERLVERIVLGDDPGENL